MPKEDKSTPWIRDDVPHVMSKLKKMQAKERKHRLKLARKAGRH
jgi:hypothetical protein